MCVQCVSAYVCTVCFYVSLCVVCVCACVCTRAYVCGACAVAAVPHPSCSLPETSLTVRELATEAMSAGPWSQNSQVSASLAGDYEHALPRLALSWLLGRELQPRQGLTSRAVSCSVAVISKPPVPCLLLLQTCPGHVFTAGCPPFHSYMELDSGSVLLKRSAGVCIVTVSRHFPSKEMDGGFRALRVVTSTEVTHQTFTL